MDKGKGQVLPYLTFREQKTNLLTPVQIVQLYYNTLVFLCQENLFCSHYFLT